MTYVFAPNKSEIIVTVVPSSDLVFVSYKSMGYIAHGMYIVHVDTKCENKFIRRQQTTAYNLI